MTWESHPSSPNHSHSIPFHANPALSNSIPSNPMNVEQRCLQRIVRHPLLCCILDCTPCVMEDPPHPAPKQTRMLCIVHQSNASRTTIKNMIDDQEWREIEIIWKNVPQLMGHLVDYDQGSILQPNSNFVSIYNCIYVYIPWNKRSVQTIGYQPLDYKCQSPKQSVSGLTLQFVKNIQFWDARIQKNNIYWEEVVDDHPFTWTRKQYFEASVIIQWGSKKTKKDRKYYRKLWEIWPPSAKPDKSIPIGLDFFVSRQIKILYLSWSLNRGISRRKKMFQDFLR